MGNHTTATEMVKKEGRFSQFSNRRHGTILDRMLPHSRVGKYLSIWFTEMGWNGTFRGPFVVSPHKLHRGGPRIWFRYSRVLHDTQTWAPHTRLNRTLLLCDPLISVVVNSLAWVVQSFYPVVERAICSLLLPWSSWFSFRIGNEFWFERLSFPRKSTRLVLSSCMGFDGKYYPCIWLVR